MTFKRKGRKYRSSKTSILWHRFKAFYGRVLYRNRIHNNRSARILVVLHLYYMEAWPFIKRYLENLSPYSYDLIVTYTTGHYDPVVLESVYDFKKEAFLVEYENKGFDIGGFLDMISKSNLQNYDIIFKLHSKGVERDFIFIYDQIFKKADWFINLYDGILGEFSVHKTVNLLMHNPSAGLVASANLIVQDPPHKRFFTLNRAAQLGVSILEEYHFVAGSCFAIKASLLSSIQGLHLSIDSFEPTRRGFFSLAHAMERIVCASIETRGQKMVGISVPHPTYLLERRYRRSISSIRLLEDNRFSLDYDYFYRSLEFYPVFSYEIKSMRIGDIRRYWEGKYYQLQECSPYAYLHGDVKGYDQYAATVSGITAFEVSRERFDELIQSMEDNGFDEKHLPVVCARDNTIWDGQHRCCWLLAHYGEDYVIPVLSLDTWPWYSDHSKSGSKMSVWKKCLRALSCKQ